MNTSLREYPLPERSGKFTDLVRMRLDEAGTVSGPRETVTVDRNGQRIHVEVIDLPLDQLFLNPATHRIRAQRSHDPGREAVLEEDPWGKRGQDYLAYLLKALPTDPKRRDPDFDKLREDLEQYGQNEAGLITRHGILVNGNTRAAALRELGKASMRVGVLPESFTWDDITAVELSLQLRNDSRREYSYINRLLAIEERFNLGQTREVIAKEFRSAAKTVDQQMWILQLLRECIERSKSGSSALRLMDFEGMQERLKELHRDYTSLAQNDPDGAEVLKEHRIAAILMQFAKTDVRWIKENFHEEYLSKHLPESLEAAVSRSDSEGEEETIPGLGISVPVTAPKVVAARQLGQLVLQAHAQVKSRGATEKEKQNALGVVEQTKNAFDAALDQAGRDGRLRMRKQLAPERLKEAAAALEQCTAEIVKARGSRIFDEDALDDAIVQFRAAFDQLARQAARGNEDPGEGLAWLKQAAGMKEREA
ncbi:hypothetical protein [Streptomyces cacaoi]|uniref:hypothetical protein n=1 Tax=Streptomyces cacaoi TaxID=1898 RepID=UPI001FD2A76F|nr:hypothetical protein [Streptomyces cacaoi]